MKSRVKALKTSSNMNLDITTSQKLFLQDTERYARFIGGIGSGKTHILTLLAILKGLQGEIVLYILPTYPMIRDVAIPTTQNHLQTLGIENNTKLIQSPPELTFSSGGKILFRSSEIGDRVRGINAHHCFYDEASYIEEEFFKISFPRARIKPNKGTNLIRLVGTPALVDQDWVQTIQGKVYAQSTMDSPFLSMEYKRDLLEKYSQYGKEFVDRELYGIFTEGKRADVLIGNDLVMKSLSTVGVSDEYDDVVIGMDVSASLSGDISVAVVRRGLEILEIKDWRIKNSVDLADEVAHLCDQYNAKKVIIDAAGVGNGVISSLQKKNLTTTITEFWGWSVSSNNLYGNNRAQAYGDMKFWMETGGKILNHEDLIKQLPQTRWLLNKRNQIMLEPKEGLIKRTGKSPDYSDAMSYACFGYKVKQPTNVLENTELMSRLEKDYASSWQ